MYALLSSEVYFLAVGVPLKNSSPAVMERLSMAITAIIILVLLLMANFTSVP